MMTARDLDSFLNSAGFKSDSTRTASGRWIDLAYIKPAAGMTVKRLRKQLPRLEEALGIHGIRLTCGKTQIILELPKTFSEITREEVGYDGNDLCLGVDRHFKPLAIDVRYGGLLVVGDHGTGKTELLEQIRETMKHQFRIVEPDEEGLIALAGSIGTEGNCGPDTLLMVDDYDELGKKAKSALLRIALTGHIDNIFTIAASASPARIDALSLFAFRNVVSFRISSERELKKTSLPLDAALLGSHGDGLLISTTMDITRFHTVTKR